MIEITKIKQLEKFVADARKSDIVCLDSEFIREKTYVPELCLIQAQTREESYLIDPFCFESLSILKDLLLDENVVKVFHACGQDLEVLRNETGVLPVNIYDVQLASTIINGLYHPSLGNLLAVSIDVHIEKSESFTDWSRRPLSPKQVKYAIEDVLYLPDLYDYQISKLKKLNRESWLEEDFAELLDEDRFQIDPKQQYLHLKRVNQLSSFELKLARDVCAWREERARIINIPRRSVISDEQVLEICKRNPRNLDDLLAIRDIDCALNISELREVLGVLAQARKKEDIHLKQDYKASERNGNVDALVDALSAICKIRGKENNISPSALANNADLSLVARGLFDEAKVMHGWRGRLLADDLLGYMNGKLSLRVIDDKLKIVV